MSIDCARNLMDAFDFLDEDSAKRVVDVAERFVARQDAAFKLSEEASSKKELRKALTDQLNEEFRYARKLTDYWQHVHQDNFKGNHVEGLTSILTRTTRNVSNRDVNVSSAENGYRRQLNGFVGDALSDPDIVSTLKKGVRDQDIFLEKWNRVHKGTTGKDAAINKTVDAIDKINDRLIQTRQEAGSTIAAREDYLISQTDNWEVVEGDVAGWARTKASRIVPESIGVDSKHPKATEKMIQHLTEMYESSKFSLGTEDVNLAGGRRKVEFKSAEDAFLHNKEFGHGTIADGVASAVTKTARISAIESLLTSNPRRLVGDLTTALAESHGYNRTDFAVVQKNLSYVMGNGFTRKANKVGTPILGMEINGPRMAEAAVVNSRLAQATLKLGKSLIANLWDIPTQIATYRTNIGGTEGNFMTFPKAIGSWASNTLNSIAPDTVSRFNNKATNRETLGRNLGFFLQDIQLDVLATGGMGSGSWLTRILAKTTSFTQTINGNKFITGRHQQSIMNGYGRLMFDAINTPMRDRSAAQGEFLKRAGNFTIKEEEVLKKAHNIWSRDNASQIIGGRDSYGPGTLEGYRALDLGMTDVEMGELKSKLYSSFHEASNASVMAGGREEVSYLRRDLPKDDPTRLFFELIMQFRGAVFKGMNTFASSLRGVNPDGALIGANSIKMVAELVVMGSVIAESKKYIDSWIKNKEYTFSDKTSFGKTILENTASIGLIYGPVGDILIGNHWSHRSSIGQRAQGPVLDQLGSMLELSNTIMTDPSQEKKISKQLSRIGNNFIPNHWLLEIIRARTEESVKGRITQEVKGE